MCYQLNYDYVHIWVSPHGEPVSGQLCACGKAAFYPAAQQPLAVDGGQAGENNGQVALPTATNA